MLRPLSPNTRAQYEKALARGVSDSETSRRLLRAALRRQALEQGQDPEASVSAVPPPAYQIRRVREFLSEADAQLYESAARQLPPGRRALALLPLALGLRAASLLELEHRAVERGVQEGVLKVLLKRGKEDLVSCGRATGLLQELLEAPAAKGRARLGEKKASRRWAWVGEILSPGALITQYHALRDLVEGVGHAAGLKGVSPHDLRHAFASRLLRDGATIADVQRALGHESPQTTMIYLHGDPGRVGQFMRQF